MTACPPISRKGWPDGKQFGGTEGGRTVDMFKVTGNILPGEEEGREEAMVTEKAEQEILPISPAQPRTLG